MAKKAKKVKVLDKWKKKRFFPVFAPKSFQEVQIGESAAYSPDLLLGRTITSNLMTLTGNIKRQNINVKFEIDKIRGDSAYTSLKQFAIIPAAIKRKVRRGKDRLDESIKCSTKDKKIIRIKPMVITGALTSSSVKRDLRKKLKDHMLKSISNMEYDALANAIINYRLQSETRGVLNKTFPVRAAEIRMMKLLDKEGKTSQ